MADVFTKEKRSQVMARIRSKNNKDTEQAMINVFQKFKITGWRRNQKVLGKPDFVFPKNKIALFVDGCFWHVCPKHCTFPKTNEEFWKKKLLQNVERDEYVNNELLRRGWNVIRVWEHELKDAEEVIKKILPCIQK